MCPTPTYIGYFTVNIHVFPALYQPPGITESTLSPCAGMPSVPMISRRKYPCVSALTNVPPQQGNLQTADTAKLMFTYFFADNNTPPPGPRPASTQRDVPRISTCFLKAHNTHVHRPFWAYLPAYLSASTRHCQPTPRDASSLPARHRPRVAHLARQRASSPSLKHRQKSLYLMIPGLQTRS